MAREQDGGALRQHARKEYARSIGFRRTLSTTVAWFATPTPAFVALASHTAFDLVQKLHVINSDHHICDTPPTRDLLQNSHFYSKLVFCLVRLGFAVDCLFVLQDYWDARETGEDFVRR